MGRDGLLSNKPFIASSSSFEEEFFGGPNTGEAKVA